jgi:serine phosphatase RsbU (regulator of sigma subunit)
VPSGCRILIYSDGASEITLDDGKTLSHQHFMRLTTRVAQSPEWSLDQVIAELQALGKSSGFEDDCSLIQITFD